jgi:hypothetical protein
MFWLLPLKMLHDHTVHCAVHSDNAPDHLTPEIKITYSPSITINIIHVVQQGN